MTMSSSNTFGCLSILSFFLILPKQDLALRGDQFQDGKVLPGYLSFSPPPKLRFHELPPSADRRNLLRLSSVGGEPAAEEAKVALEPSEESFPLVSYTDEEENSSSYVIPFEPTMQAVPQEAANPIPPSDPFVGAEYSGVNVNQTDELMDLLESSSQTRKFPQSGPRVEFIPPYSLDGGSVMIQSRAKYTRRNRQ